MRALAVEVEAQELLGNNPGWVKLYDKFDEHDYFYITMELLTGGELFDRIVEKERYTEREAREIIRQLATSIAYAHSKGACGPRDRGEGGRQWCAAHTPPPQASRTGI